MANGLDTSITIKKETTYGTAVVTNKALEFAEESFSLTPERLKAKTLRSGGKFGLAAKSPIAFRSGAGDLTVEACPKGQGILWEMALGSGASNLVSEGLYQQVYKMADVLPSYTMQLGLPQFSPTAGTWSVNPFTFVGCMASSWELTLPNGGILELKLSINARDGKDDIAFVDPASLYPAASVPYHFGSACIYSGTISEPTTTALIDTAGLTPIASVVSATLKVDNSLSTGTRRLCAGGLQARPLPGQPVGTGTLVVDYVADTFTDAIFADTGFSMVMDFTGAEAADRLQVLVQDFRINGDAMPKPNNGQPLTQTVPFQLFDKVGQTSPIIVVQRTADAAI